MRRIQLCFLEQKDIPGAGSSKNLLPNKPAQCNHPEFADSLKLSLSNESPPHALNFAGNSALISSSLNVSVHCFTVYISSETRGENTFGKKKIKKGEAGMTDGKKH